MKSCPCRALEMGALDPMRSRHMLHVLLFVTVLLVEVAFTATTAEGKKWLNQNKNQDGVIETKTGLPLSVPPLTAL